MRSCVRLQLSLILKQRMNHVLLTTIATFVLLAFSNLRAQSSGEEKPPQKAELVRTINAQILGPDGFPRGTRQLSKGVIFDVESQTFADVIGKMNGQKIRVPKQAVTLSEKEEPLVATVAGFKPGQLVILSARYSLEGNAPRNVKTNLQKFLPENGMLTEPFQFVVSDALSTAAGNQKTLIIGSQTSAVVTTQGPNQPPQQVIVTQTQTSAVATSPNVLVVEYAFNGKKKRKVGVEGQMMVLP